MREDFRSLVVALLLATAACGEAPTGPALPGDGVDLLPEFDFDVGGGLDVLIVYNGNQGEALAPAESAPAQTAIYVHPEGFSLPNVVPNLTRVAGAAGQSAAQLYMRFAEGEDGSLDVCSRGTTALDAWNNLMERVGTFRDKTGIAVVGIAFEKEKTARPFCETSSALVDPIAFLSMANQPDQFPPEHLDSGARYKTLLIESGFSGVGKISPTASLAGGLASLPSGPYEWDSLLGEYSYEPYDKKGESVFCSGSPCDLPTQSMCLPGGSSGPDADSCVARCSLTTPPTTYRQNSPCTCQATDGPASSCSPDDCSSLVAGVKCNWVGQDQKPCACPRLSSKNVPCTVTELGGAKLLIDAGLENPAVLDPQQTYTLAYGGTSKGDCRTIAQGAITYAASRTLANGRRVLALFL